MTTETTQPITMDDSQQPEQVQDTTPQNADRFFRAIMTTVQTFIAFEVQKAIMSNVDRLVETKFQAMVENRRTLALMDQALETMIDQKIEAAVTVAIDRHEDNEEHHTQEDIEQMAADQARATLREYAERQEGWVTKDQVNDIVTTQIDEELDMIDWEEKVKDVLRDML